jgi:serine/threonine protein kinase
MDYFEGRSFLDMMLKQSKIIKNQNWKQNVINSLLVSVNLLHKSGIMHRDIYPGNILFKNKEVAMLGNFGSSIQK